MTTTEQYDAAKWDAYNESTLIRGLVYAKYDDIRSICRLFRMKSAYQM